jgi:16S rRNA U516 pseudouridylate synthase RsuA-like enzyme
MPQSKVNQDDQCIKALLEGVPFKDGTPAFARRVEVIKVEEGVPPTTKIRVTITEGRKHVGILV